MQHMLRHLGSMPALRSLSMAAINHHAHLSLACLHGLTHLAIAAHTLQLVEPNAISIPAALVSVHLLCLKASTQTIDYLSQKVPLHLQHRRVECYYVLEGKLGPPHHLDIDHAILDDLISADDVA